MRRPPPLFGVLALAASLFAGGPAAAQSVDQLSEDVREFVRVDAPAFAITNVLLIDGTGAPARSDQTVVVRDGRIAEISDAAGWTPPAGMEVIDGSGHTLIPGMVGLHNHLFYTAGDGRLVQANFTSPRLYLGSGVTTVRTTGSENAYAELNLDHEVKAGRVPGPRIHITAPYITSGAAQRGSSMTVLDSPEAARRFVQYWAAEGATWIKAYTNVGYDEMQATVDEAHRLGMKVTGHICSISYKEAAEMGFDNVEHGLFSNSDYSPNRTRGQCPNSLMSDIFTIDPAGPEAQETFAALIDAGVPMTSTLAVFELFVQGRPVRDPRSLEAMEAGARDAYLESKAMMDVEGLPPEALTKGMAYERAFVDAGGVLASGVDPTGNGGALPGYGDQRNVELLSEAGFSAEEVVQITTLNGARVLEVDDELGSVEIGKIADLVLMSGDLTRNPSAIRDVTVVFKDGVGYDSPKLFAAVVGRVGIN